MMTFDRQITYRSQVRDDVVATIKVATRQERAALQLAIAQAKPKDSMRLLRSLEQADGDQRTIDTMRDMMVMQYELPIVFRDLVLSVDIGGTEVTGQQFAADPENGDELLLELFHVAQAAMGMTREQQKKFLSAFTSTSPATPADQNTTAETASNAA